MKNSVKFGSSQLAMSVMLQVVHNAFAGFGFPCVITSANDSTHGTNSLHGQDKAFDFRTKHIQSAATKKAIIDEIKTSLTVDYDIVFENEGLENEHLHCEYDKK